MMRKMKRTNLKCIEKGFKDKNYYKIALNLDFSKKTDRYSIPFHKMENL